MRQVKRFILFFLGCFLLVSSFDTSFAEWGGVTEAIEEGRRDNKPIILKFESDNCSACDKLNTFTLEDPEVKKILECFATAKVDVYDAKTIAYYNEKKYTYRELTKLFKIKARPTSLFLSPDGTVIDEVRGYIPRQTYIQILETILRDRARD